MAKIFTFFLFTNEQISANINEYRFRKFCSSHPAFPLPLIRYLLKLHSSQSLILLSLKDSLFISIYHTSLATLWNSSDVTWERREREREREREKERGKQRQNLIFHTSFCWWSLWGAWVTVSRLKSPILLISNSTNFFSKLLGTAPIASTTFVITVIFMSHNFFSSLARSRYLSIFSFFKFSLYGLLEQ